MVRLDRDGSNPLRAARFLNVDAPIRSTAADAFWRRRRTAATLWHAPRAVTRPRSVGVDGTLLQPRTCSPLAKNVKRRSIAHVLHTRGGAGRRGTAAEAYACRQRFWCRPTRSGEESKSTTSRAVQLALASMPATVNQLLGSAPRAPRFEVVQSARPVGTIACERLPCMSGDHRDATGVRLVVLGRTSPAGPACRKRIER